MAIIKKGKILRSDFNYYDGVTLTGSRPDSTGGTTTGLKIGDEVDILQAYGSGENYTVSTINSALATINGSVTLKFSPGTWVIDEDLSIPSNFTCLVPDGASFSISSNITLTIKGNLQAGNYQIFTGSGVTSFSGGEQNELRAEWFGVVADGATDNATSLIRLRDCMHEDRTIGYKVWFPDGEVQHTNNRFLWGINDVIIYAYGTSFRNIRNATYEREERPLKLNDIFDDNGDIDYPGDSYLNNDFGYQIDSVTTTTRTITTTTADDAGNFSTDDYVLIYGQEQSGSGYPPNPRYFEYNKVVSADSGTGNIVLEKMTRNKYYSTWWDWYDFGSGTDIAGKARVMNLTRTNMKIAERLHIHGAKWLGNSTVGSASDNFVFDGVLDGQLIDNNFDDLKEVSPTMCDSVLLSNCKIGCGLEPDKVTRLVVIEDCQMPSDDLTNKKIAGCTGVERIEFRRNFISNRQIVISPKVGKFIDNEMIGCQGATTLVSLMGDSYGFYAIKRMELEGNRFRNHGTWVNSESPVFAGASIKNVTVDSVGTSDEILLAKTGANLELLDLIEGNTIMKDDGSTYGVITNIVDYDATYIAVEGTWETAPVAAETWKIMKCQELIDKNNDYDITGTRLIPWVDHLTSYHTGEPQDLGRIIVTNDQIDYDENGYILIDMLGYIYSVKTHIFKAYSGSSTTPVIKVEMIAGASPGAISTVDLATTGTRYVDSMQTAGGGGGDTLTSANCMVFCSRLYVNATHSGGGVLAGTVDQMPHCVIEITYAKMPKPAI